MALAYKTRRFLSTLLLCVGLPIYIVVAVTLVGYLDRPPVLVELLIYAVCGILWALPFKNIFKGVGVAEDKNSVPNSNSK